jgi:hypothetical protein
VIPSTLIDALGDRYAIERELWDGGMATVNLAHGNSSCSGLPDPPRRPQAVVVLNRLDGGRPR